MYNNNEVETYWRFHLPFCLYESASEIKEEVDAVGANEPGRDALGWSIWTKYGVANCFQLNFGRIFGFQSAECVGYLYDLGVIHEVLGPFSG